MQVTWRRLAIGCALATVAVALGARALYCSLFCIPGRPGTVGAKYTFVWLDTWTPSNRGVWMACRPTAAIGAARCRIVDQQGRRIIDVEYRPYPPGARLPAGPLRVDPSTDWYDGVNLSSADGRRDLGYAPFIRLAGGPTLLPATGYTPTGQARPAFVPAYAGAAKQCRRENCAPRK
jgi:hypothetical protein